MKTSAVRKHTPAWHILDANEVVLGRLSTKAADLLRGKGKTTFEPYLDCGDHVIVINAAKVALTGNKLAQKTYYRHSQYPGGLKSITAEKLLEKRPEQIIQFAVAGMLPKNKLQKLWLQRLHVYAGSEHPHQANIAGDDKN
jgi:large subunit ribosomal protein L13